MNKTELVKALAEKLGVSVKQAGETLAKYEEVVTEGLVNGEEVKTGIGTYKVKDRESRTGHNPKTGESIEIPASKVPSFKVGKALKDAVNGVK